MKSRATLHRDEKPADWWPPTPDYATHIIQNRLIEAAAERVRARELHIAGRVREAEECERAAVRHRDYAASLQARFWPSALAIEPAALEGRVVGIHESKRGRS